MASKYCGSLQILKNYPPLKTYIVYKVLLVWFKTIMLSLQSGKYSKAQRTQNKLFIKYP
jgi:hypothetical protein